MAFDLMGVALPYNPEAELSVIGGLVADSRTIEEVIETLKSEHFYSDVNHAIYDVITAMFMNNKKVDIVTISDECTDRGVFGNVSEAKKYLFTAVQSAPSYSASSVKTYANIVTDKYLLRSLIMASKDIIDRAASSEDAADSVVDYAEQKIYNIRAGREKSTLTPLSQIIYERMNSIGELIEEVHNNGGQPVMSGLATGFTLLDRQIYGLNKSDLIILAARPGMGKTSFALNIAVKASMMALDKKVCVFSLEMSKEQLGSRILCSEAGVASDLMKTGKVSQKELDRIADTAQALQTFEIYIDDTPGASVAGIKSKLRREANIGLVIIDYLQLMTSAESYGGNRVSQMSEITRNLKIMAKELDVPIIALSQLARGPEQRPDKRPLLSDLRDSGSIEQDADIVLFLYRNSYYDKTDPNPGVCECIVAKNRHGETGKIDLGWQGEYTRFTNAEIHRTGENG